MCQAFLADTVETGTNNRFVMEATHVLRRKLSKDLELFGNVSVHEFYRLKALITLEQVNTELAKLRWSGVVNFHCMQMRLGMSM